MEKRGSIIGGGMTSMQGGRGTGRLSLYLADDGGGEEIKGETEGEGWLT